MMTTHPLVPRSRRPSTIAVGPPTGAAWLSLGVAGILTLSACVAEPTPSPSATQAATRTPTSSEETEAPSRTPAGTAAATPEPRLSLPLPPPDPRQISVTVSSEVAVDGGGQITVTVTSAADAIVDELVLRWPTELLQTLFLAPSVPDPDLVQEGGGNLVVPWTKWVIGPGEQGEPEGTTSLGYGPLQAGATLTIPLYVTRLAPGPTSFDLQLLAGESILTLSDGQPAELRIEVP